MGSEEQEAKLVADHLIAANRQGMILMVLA